jgi:teichuronic acid biosynthesis glycosyltransferase TuaG
VVNKFTRCRSNTVVEYPRTKQIVISTVKTKKKDVVCRSIVQRCPVTDSKTYDKQKARNSVSAKSFLSPLTLIFVTAKIVPSKDLNYSVFKADALKNKCGFASIRQYKLLTKIRTASTVRLMPLVSIITPIYNAEKFLEKTLESVFHQTYSNFELLLILDKNSSDRSKEISENWAQKNARIKVFQNLPHGGVAFNRNFALSQAKGDYICFLDSDDLWEPNKLAQQVSFMQSAECDFSCTGFRKISAAGIDLKIEVIPPSIITSSSLLKNNRIGCLTVMLKKSLAQHVQFQDVMHEDMVYWLEALKMAKVAYGMPQVLACYRVVTGSRSSNKITSALGRWNILRNIEKMSLPSALYYFTHYAFTSFKKY